LGLESEKDERYENKAPRDIYIYIKNNNKKLLIMQQRTFPLIKKKKIKKKLGKEMKKG